MSIRPFVPLAIFAFSVVTHAADNLPSKTTYAKAYGETKGVVEVDPAKDLPRYPAVEPKDAIATWQVKKGFHLELAAHEPQVRSPIALSYDERGRMFVCEMIDYSEMRDVTPHLGRVSMLEDKDGDGYFETSQVFADGLPWPTGVICANGGIYVIATPDLWFFKDTDGDGKADVREKIFTGFGTGLKLLNVQGLANSPTWGQDNRIHILAGGGNRGVIRRVGVPPANGGSGILPEQPGKMPGHPSSGETPDLQPGIELGGKDFWFDPRTLEFGLEAGGAQYGMSFDNYGRKFGCSNSDHLQYWVYDDKYANRNPHFQMPPSRQSIAVDGGAAEVFRISPDEPWRIIRTRWRISGVVKGVVEGGGRVSGYFTGATGTTIYRGDAYGDEFLNNSFTGDAGGQLVHRKIIRPSEDGVSLIGERPADEHGFEFAASKDTWVRVVNFANAPDGCLNIIDMYREVIEHPHSIPDEIKKYIDLNNGNDRGRIYRIVPDNFPNRRGTKVNLADASTEELVKTLSHPNGWHRDTAQRLLYERNDKAAVAFAEKVIAGDNALAKLHAIGVLQGAGALNDSIFATALKDRDAQVREHGVLAAMSSPALFDSIVQLVADPSPRVRFVVATALSTAASGKNTSALTSLAKSDSESKWTSAAVLGAADGELFAALKPTLAKLSPEFATSLITKVAASDKSPAVQTALLDAVAGDKPRVAWIRALGAGFQRAGTTIAKVDTTGKLAALFAKATANAVDPSQTESARLEAIALLGLSSSKEANSALKNSLTKGQPDAIQAAAITLLANSGSAKTTEELLKNWPDYGTKAKAAALDAFLARDERALAFLEANLMKPADFSPSQVQALVHHKDAKVAAMAKTVLASVIPPSREEMIEKFKPALGIKGDVKRGEVQFAARCIACHRANGQGILVGPDLVTVKTKGREALLTAILEPHKEVAPQFIAYTVNTKDGQTLSGIVTKDDASSMTLMLMGGAEINIPRSNIKGSSSSGQSLMPEGIEAGIDVQGMADLLDFIESVK